MTTTFHPPSPACYKRGCKQPACVTVGRRYAKRLNYDHSRGLHRRRDATQARAHIERLTAHKWSHRQIGRVAGIPRSTIDVIAAGQPTTSKRIALAILSVPIGPAPVDPTWVDPTGTVRRLRALAHMRYAWADLAEPLGMSVHRLSNLANETCRVVRATEAETVAKLYRQLAAIPGPSPRAHTSAARRGWHGPLAWDAIDDPNSQPETLDPFKDGIRRPRGLADPARVMRLTTAGKSAAEIARDLGVHKRTVIRARGRARQLAVAA